MIIEYVPLLQVQRKLQGMPRNRERFMTYLQTIGARDSGGILELPSLMIANPMGKDHVTRYLDELLAMQADEIAAQAVAEVTAQFPQEPGEFKIAMVVADDLMGGWTNRCADEYTLRFPPALPTGHSGDLPRWLKDFWLTAVLWTSDKPSAQRVQDTVTTVIHRIVWLRHHGVAQTLREMLVQEGAVLARAGCKEPMLDLEDIEYTREVLAPCLDSTDKRTIMECLFGDEACKTLGFSPRGLSHWAGLALALHDSQYKEVTT
ncbi:MAG TPA: hypothetical protein PLN21_20265 [Gemmatales bacterium]|nr:hypothetical protein [Gemmatales bacterium]